MGEEEICAICLEDCSKVEDNCMIWWCEHVYHKCCMNKLLEYKRYNERCPMCRTEIKNIVDLSDKMDVYIYKSIKDEKNDKYEKELNRLISTYDKDKLDTLMSNVLNEYIEMEIVEEDKNIKEINNEDMRLYEEMIWFNY
jgi:hypothetical protein